MLAAVFFFLSLGPVVYLGGQPILHLEWLYRLFYKSSVLSVSRTPSRYGIVVALAFSVAGAVTLEHVRSRLGRWGGLYVALVVLLTGLFFLETCPRALRVRDAYFLNSRSLAHIAADSRDLVILNVPVDYIGARGGGDEYLYEQTFHGKKIVGGYVSRETRQALQVFRQSAFLQSIPEVASRKRVPFDPEKLDGFDIAAELRLLGVKLVVVQKRFLGGLWAPYYRKFLRAGCLPSVEDELRAVCEIK